jgi:TolB protein
MKKVLVVIFGLGSLFVYGADDEVKIRVGTDALGFPPPIPVTISGFSGEVDSVLRSDLSFMGFEFVTADKARYNIQKNNAAGVGAQINDPLSRQSIYNKAFTGPSARQQTHALADDIAKTLTQKPGIARTRIAFKVRPKSYGEAEIYISDYDGFNAQPVTKDGAICASPSWGGNGSLFYMSHKISGKPDILSHNLATGARKQINRVPADAFSPAASPDGQRVAMILAKAGSPDLWVADADGGNLKQLTMSKEDESCPCWSPDGSKICFTSRQSGKAQLYTIPASGGTMQRISIAGAINLSEPDWSPDGKYIVFTANMGGFQICVVPMEGSSRGTATALVAGEDPVWAPNSRAVMFVKEVNHRHILTLLDVPSKKTKEIGLINGDASQPSWAR